MRLIASLVLLASVWAGSVLAQVAPPPPPDAERPALSWYVSNEGKVSDKAYTEAEITLLIKQGKVTAETYVFRVGTVEWGKAKADAALQLIFRKEPPAPPKTERYERLLVGTWRSELPTIGNFARWFVVTYYEGGKVFAINYTSVQDGVTPPTAVESSGTWKIEDGAQADEFRLLQTFPTGNANYTFRVSDQNAVVDVATGSIMYRMQ